MSSDTLGLLIRRHLHVMVSCKLIKAADSHLLAFASAHAV